MARVFPDCTNTSKYSAAPSSMWANRAWNSLLGNKTTHPAAQF